MLDFANLVSLILTVPTVLLAVMVVRNYLPRARSALGHIFGNTGKTTETDLLIVGIVAGFVGAICDNVYWGITWGLHFLEHPATATWFEHGVLSNIPFRQLAGVIAATFHLAPVIQGKKRNKYLTAVAVATLVTSIALIMQKYL